jgi:hypothetical protein
LLLIVSLAFGLVACGNSGPKTHKVKKWADAQEAIDNSKSNDIIDLSKLSTPDQAYVLVIPATYSLTLRGNPDEVFIGLAVDCVGENTLTLDNLRMVSTSTDAHSAIQFVSYGNQLILIGTNEVIFAETTDPTIGSGAAIGISQSATLTISGSGSLHAVGGGRGAGIGSGFGVDAGTIYIREGVIRAEGGNIDSDLGGAGIGSGANATFSNITMTGGTVYAIGGRNRAGIGSTQGSGGGLININGGELMAQAGSGNDAQAINGNIESLPGSYTWWATTTRPPEESNAGTNFPDEPFSNAQQYRYVWIKSR